MITPKEAVKKAKEYLYDIAADESIEDLRVEEVEFESKRRLWFITLGYFRPRTTKLNLAKTPSSPYSIFPDKDEERRGVEDRVYKRFKIDAESGLPQSMTIREVR